MKVLLILIFMPTLIFSQTISKIHGLDVNSVSEIHGKSISELKIHGLEPAIYILSSPYYLPDWYYETAGYLDSIWFDPDDSGVNLGTFDDPYRNTSDLSGSWLDSTVYLFKRSTEMTISSSYKLRFNDSFWRKMTSYGTGDRPIIKAASDFIMVSIEHVNKGVMEDLYIQAYDISTADRVVEFYEGDGDTEGMVLYNNEIWGGNAAIVMMPNPNPNRGIPYINDAWIVGGEYHHQNVDCILPREVDTLYIIDNWIYDFNQKAHIETHSEAAGGDGIQTGDQCNVLYIYNNIIDHSGTVNKYCVLIAGGSRENQYVEIIGNTFFPPKDTVAIGSLVFTGTGNNDLEFEDEYDFPRDEHGDSDSTWWYTVEIQSEGSPDKMRYSINDGGAWYESDLDVSTNDIAIGEDEFIYVDEHQSSAEIAAGDLYDTIDLRINIRFGSATGHSTGDEWYFMCSSDTMDKGGAALTLQHHNTLVNTAVIARNKFIGRVAGKNAYSLQAAMDVSWDTIDCHHNEFDSINHNKGANKISHYCDYLKFNHNTIIAGNGIESQNALDLTADSASVNNNKSAGNTSGDVLRLGDINHLDSTNNFEISTAVSAEIDSYLNLTDWEGSDFSPTSNLNDGKNMGYSYDIDSTLISDPPEAGAREYIPE